LFRLYKARRAPGHLEPLGAARMVRLINIRGRMERSWPLAHLAFRASALGQHRREPQAGIDERHMGEGLREISEHSPIMRIVFFGNQADVIAQFS
jgi:hypothetical protein